MTEHEWCVKVVRDWWEKVSKSPLPPQEFKRTNPDCKHLHASVRDNDPIGRAFCPACGGLPHLSDVFNNWLNEFKAWKGPNER